MKIKQLRLFYLVVSAMWAAPLAQAGPPLAIDDPGILDPGQWEIIAAGAYSRSDGSKVMEIPIADISYGLTENIQASASWAFVFADPTAGGDDDQQFGNPGFGVKWRFVNTDRLQVAFAPGYSFGISQNAAGIGIGDDTDVGFIPINFEYALGADWTLNGELGYAAVREDADEWAYGLALGHPFGASVTGFFELYGATNDEFDDRSLNFHFGADFEVSPTFHVLASVGSGLTAPSGSDTLDFDAFLGLQWFR